MKLKDLQFTDGEWILNGNKVQVNPKDPMHTITIAMLFGNISQPENIGNGLLISHAPNMLELLKSTGKTLSEYISVRGIDRDEDDLKQLLTEINNLLNS